MSAEEAIPRIKKVISKEVTFWFRELARTYPHHPETRRILFECDAFEWLLSIEGLRPDVHERAFALVDSGSAPSADILSVLGATRSERGLRHLLQFAENPYDTPIQGYAIKMLAEHFPDRLQVKTLLKTLAAPESTNKCTQLAARRAIAWGYRGQSWAVDFLLLAERSEADALIDFVDDPDYSKWLNRRHEWREELEDILLRTTRDEGWKAFDAVHGLALFFGEQTETKELFLTMATANPPPSSSKNPKIRLGHRMADFYVWKAVICLRTAVMLWKDDPDVLRAVHAALDHPDREFKEEAARLLSRAYSCHPETANRLRQYLAESLIIFGEYIGLRMGDLEAMFEGLAVLAALPDTPAARAMAQDGPLYLVRFFGPRKDLLQELLRIGAAGPTWVQEGVVKALERFYRHRNPISLDSGIAFARSKALEKKDGQDWDRVLQLAKADPAPSVRLHAIEALFGRDGNDPRALDALKAMVAEGHAEGLFLLGSKCPEDGAALDWLLGLHQTGAFSPNPHASELLTTCVATHFTRVGSAAAFLMDRARATSGSKEFNASVEGLCKIYGHDAEVRVFLDSHTMDPRLDYKTAGQVLSVRSAGLQPGEKIGLLLNILNDHRYSDMAAKYQAAREVSYMLGRDGFPKGSAENAIVANALTVALEHHPSLPIRRNLGATLGSVLMSRGPTHDAGWKEYQRIADTLKRLGEYTYGF